MAPPLDPKKDPDSPQLEAFIARHVADLECCYARGRRDNRRLEGRIIAGWKFDPAGDVSEYWTFESTLDSPPVVNCMGDLVCGWHFPPLEESRPGVLWSFVFKN
jgi:hypothetical protein